MAKHTAKRCRTCDVADQLHVLTRPLERQRGTLRFAADADDSGMGAECATATLMDHACRGADVCVAERCQVLLHEVDEAPLALQQRKQLQRRVG